MDASTQSGSLTATRTSKPPTSKRSTSDGRRSRRSSPLATTETASEREETESPLTDSNRRPPPYHFESVTRVHARSLATHILLQIRRFQAADVRRKTSRVSFRMCPFCVRALLTTSTNAAYLTAREPAGL